MVDSPQIGNHGALDRLLAQARTAVERENWALAEDRLAKVATGRPQDLEVVRLLAQVLRERGKVGEAEALLVKAWKAAVAAAVVAVDAGIESRRELLLELADLRLTDGRPAEAARVLGRVLEVEPNQWEALWLLGNAFFDGGHMAEAANAYRESISANPFEAEPWWNLATALERVGEAARAADALEGWLGVVADGTEAAERERVLAEIARLRAPSPERCG